MKNSVAVLIFVFFVMGLFPRSFIFAQKSSLYTIQVLQQQIAELQKQIVELQTQLKIVKKTEVPPTENIRFTKTLQLGIRDDEVKTLQEFLKQYSDIYPEGLVTGYFGSLTENAVKKFQIKYNIESVGIVGPKTRQKLNELAFAKPEIKPEEKIVKPITTPATTPPPISTPTPTPALTPKTTSPEIKCSDGTSYYQCSLIKPKYCDNGNLKDNCQICGCGTNGVCKQNGDCFQSGPPATWPEWLKQERMNNIEDVLKAEEFMRSAGRKSILNDNLPQFIEWTKEHGINLIGIKKTEESKSDFWNLTARKMSLTAVPGIDERFEMFKKLPEHLLNLARGQAIFFWGEDCIGYVTPVWHNEELSQSYQKKLADIPEDARCTYVPEGLSFPWSGGCLSPYDMFVCKGIGLEIHEFGHIVDFNGISMYKGREFALGKTDEGIRELYNEYKRVFEPTEEQRTWKKTDQPPPGMLDYGQANSLENFAVHFDYYVRRPEQFREKAAQNSSLAEKYEFLKTKIFLGKEY